jgi:hypothetical protein
MALNPPLIPGGTLPLPVNGETFVLQRKGVLFDADVQVAQTLGVKVYGLGLGVRDQVVLLRARAFSSVPLAPTSRCALLPPVFGFRV